jgi:hypothetical protein
MKWKLDFWFLAVSVLTRHRRLQTDGPFSRVSSGKLGMQTVDLIPNAPSQQSMKIIQFRCSWNCFNSRPSSPSHCSHVTPARSAHKSRTASQQKVATENATRSVRSWSAMPEARPSGARSRCLVANPGIAPCLTAIRHSDGHPGVSRPFQGFRRMLRTPERDSFHSLGGGTAKIIRKIRPWGHKSTVELHERTPWGDVSKTGSIGPRYGEPHQ